MRRQINLIALILLALVILDLAVAGVLATVGPRSLVTYFEYGRSVPGKLQAWLDQPNSPGNLFDVAWRDAVIGDSARKFAETPDAGSTVRAYGMSFVNQILTKARDLDQALVLDLHGGPGAPPNYTYALFHDDRPNRRSGDVVVLGVLSSSVAAMASMSNQTWNFEQPAPFTYPIWQLDGDNGLIAEEPLIQDAQTMRRALEDPALWTAWTNQLASEDASYTSEAYAAPLLDQSPFLRLVRRSWIVNGARTKNHEVLAGGYPWPEVLRRMILDFAITARADGQLPVVMLIQGRDPDDPDLLASLGSELTGAGIPYLATSETADPRVLSNYLSDGHLTDGVNRLLAVQLNQLLAGEGVR